MRLYLLPAIEHDDVAKYSAQLTALGEEMDRDGYEPFAPIAYEVADKEGKPTMGTMVLARRRSSWAQRVLGAGASPLVLPGLVLGMVTVGGLGAAMTAGLALLTVLVMRGAP
jgi:hypothetical protein